MMEFLLSPEPRESARTMPSSARHVALVCLAFALVLFLADCLSPRGIADGMLFTLVVVIAASAGERALVLAVAGSCTVLSTAGFLMSGPSVNVDHTLINRGVSLLLLWTMAGILMRRIRVERQHDEAVIHREEFLARIKVLHGLLPICAHCKKIREIDGHWEQLEAYIHQHSEADFTHTICEKCALIHYGVDLSRLPEPVTSGPPSGV